VGSVEDLFVGAPADPLTAVGEAEAVAGRGLRGDRYFDGTGHFSAPGKSGQDLTLVAAEALDALHAETGIALSGAAARRNVLTRGVDLDALIGRRFRIGEVECLGRRWCEPCAHLQRLTEPGVLRGLVHRGGLRADVLSGGRIARGDEIRAVSI
jgi:MOSC domain-containing protein YiiM